MTNDEYRGVLQELDLEHAQHGGAGVQQRGVPVQQRLERQHADPLHRLGRRVPGLRRGIHGAQPELHALLPELVLVPVLDQHLPRHLTQVKGTDDYSCYGYSCVRGLTAARNLNHADTYAQFAQAIRVNC